MKQKGMQVIAAVTTMITGVSAGVACGFRLGMTLAFQVLRPFNDPKAASVGIIGGDDRPGEMNWIRKGMKLVIKGWYWIPTAVFAVASAASWFAAYRGKRRKR